MLETDDAMTILQPMRKLAGPAACLILACAAAACSSKGDTAGAEAQGGSATGGSATTGASGADGTGGGVVPDAVVGTFQVQILVDDKDPTTGTTKVVGQVGDGPIPGNVVWTLAKQDGDCRLETPTVPFCEQGCGADVCTSDGTCTAYPTGHSVGNVTLTGANVTGAGTSLMLKEIAKVYQPPAGTAFAYPPFGAGDDIALHATGGDYQAFDLSTKGVDPLLITSTDFELDTDKPFTLTWNAAADPQASQIYLKLDISHHGGIRGMIECDSDDTGSLTISASLMTELIGLGVAGFPSVVMMRRSTDTTNITPGHVVLEVSSRAERYVTVKGVDSCTTDDDCPTGQTCQSDSTCAK